MIAKVTSITILLLSYAFCGNAQTLFGVKAGLNISSIHVVNLPKSFRGPEALAGFHLGVYTRAKIDDRVFLYPELLYTQRGARDGDIKLKINYIELPIIFSYALIETLAIDGGASLAFRISAKAKADGASANLGSLYDKKIDLGINAGVRFQFSEKLSGTARYYFGALPIAKSVITDFGGNSYEMKEYNRSIQVGIAYQFN
jgi:hypothetical protein